MLPVTRALASPRTPASGFELAPRPVLRLQLDQCSLSVHIHTIEIDTVFERRGY